MRDLALFLLDLVWDMFRVVFAPKTLPPIALALLLGASQLEAQSPRRTTTNSVTPQCNLGTDWAVNKNRPVASDEKLYRLEGGPAIVAQREAPGSTHIVYRRCSVPPGTEAYCSIRGCWIKVCGNDLSSPEGWKFPIEVPMGAPGINGRDGKDGANGRDGKDGQVVYAPPVAPRPNPLFPAEEPIIRGRGFPTWAKWAIGTGVVIGTGFVVANNWPRHKDEKRPSVPYTGPGFSVHF